MTRLSLLFTITLICSSAFAQGPSPAASYGFLAHAAFNDQADDNSGVAIIGILNLDKAGGVTGSYTLEVGGHAGKTSRGFSGSLSGAYTANPDGSGTLTITPLELNFTVTFATVLTDGGQVMQLLSTQTAGNANNLAGGAFPVTGPALALTGAVPLDLLSNMDFSGGSIPLSLKGTYVSDTGAFVYTATGSGSGTTTCPDGSSSSFTATVSAFSAVVYMNPGAPGGATGDYLVAVNVNACGESEVASLSGIVSGSVAPGGAGNLLLHGSGSLFSGIARAGQAGSITGKYGYQFENSGFPAGNVGVLNFDGAGNFTIAFTTAGPPGISANLPISNGTRNGTYTLNGDGTGALATIPPAGSSNNPATYSFVITDNGARILLLRTDSFASTSVTYGIARAQ